MKHLAALTFLVAVTACSPSTPNDTDETQNSTTPAPVDNLALQAINAEPRLVAPDVGELKKAAERDEEAVRAKLPEDLEIKLWASDLLVADPVALDMDDQGHVYFTRTHRQKNSEFDIRGHRHWEFDSVILQSVEDKRAFLKKIFATEKSADNTWLRDMNADGVHDWRDLKVEKEQVYRLTDSDGDGLADQSLLVVEDFHDETTDVAGALLAHDNNLFVGVGPDMWKLTDEDGNGVMDSKLSMAHGFGIHVGFSGHGMSGAELGPDGRIYWGIGDIGFHGKGNDEDGKTWRYPNRGVIVRSNPDGTDFEVFAMGVRNTHEFAFDAYGNLISVDNDGDHPGESERIVYLTEGSDSGWRINWQLGKYRDPKNNSYKVWMDERLYVPHFEGQAAHITPAIANYVNGPTGMVYNPGTALAPRWRNTFFVVEFIGDPARSGVHAFKLKPKGASFELTHTEHMVDGLLATGMDFGPDGALYLADWIDGWGTKDRGRVWKLDTVAKNTWPARKQTAELLPQDFKTFHPQKLAHLLASEDMRIRLKAQFALAQHHQQAAVDIFTTRLKPGHPQLARIHAIWGLAQMARAGQAELAEHIIPHLQDDDAEIRAQAARWLGDMRYQNAAEGLVPLLADSEARVRFFAAEALGRIAYAPAAENIIAMLRKDNGEDPFLRHAGTLALARMGNESALSVLASDQQVSMRIAAVVALRRMASPALANFLNDTNEIVLADAARAIHDDDSVKEALPALGKLLENYTGEQESIIRRAISANLRLGDTDALQRVLRYADNADAPIAMREEALASVATWASPSIFDRVDGQYRGHIERDAKPIAENAGETLQKLIQHENAVLRMASIRALGALDIRSSAGDIAKALQSDKNEDVRKAALLALSVMQNINMDEHLSIAMQDDSTAVRATALDLLDRSQLSAELKAELLAKIVNNGGTEEVRAAYSSLTQLPSDQYSPIFQQQFGLLAQRNLNENVVLDLVLAVEKTANAALNTQLQTALESYAQNDLEKAFPGATHGGDAARGRNVFRWHQSAQCMKCHSLGEEPKAGPRLGNIGNILNTEELLQALVEPSARIAPGFGTDISSMPNMSYFLSKDEIRDVVAFLESLKDGEAQSFSH